MLAMFMGEGEGILSVLGRVHGGMDLFIPAL